MSPSTNPVWKSICPRCGVEDHVRIHDRGIMFLLRLLLANNRFSCLRCGSVWRRTDPEGYTPAPVREEAKPRLRQV
jgi:hypothetical protein